MNKNLDKIKRTVCGVGYKLTTLTTELNGSRKPYSVWKNMIYRCYSKSDDKYRFYGGNGVTVSDDWHCYDNFRRDIEHLEGFDEFLFYENKLELDKDLLSEENKIYSKETCRWVSREDNMSLVKKGKYQPQLVNVKLVALSPNDDLFCIINIPLFADEMGLNKSAIYQTLYDYGNKTHKGWCFKKVTDFNNVNTINRDEFKQTRHGVVPTKYKVIDGNGTVHEMDSVVHVADFLGCSKSLINQRTRNGKEFKFKDYYISRKKD